MEKRLNIGLLIDDPNNNFSAQAARGAELACKAIDANLFIYPGHYIGKADSKFGAKEYEYQYNSVFSLPSAKALDIIYVLLGIIGSRADEAVQRDFLSKLPNVPIVTLFSDVEGYESVTFDNRSGLYAVMDHLVSKHGAKKIGYVSGPLSNVDAVERLQAFKQFMSDRELPVSINSIVYGDFTEESRAVTEELLDKNPDLDAIVFANDNMAIGGYEALKARGLKPGKDILVTGFDDESFSVTMDPPLTSVEASSAHLTYQAVLNAPQYVTKNTGANVEVETYLVQRNSCGCEGLDLKAMQKDLHIDIMSPENRSFIGAINKYLFGIFEEDHLVAGLKKMVSDMCNAVLDYTEGAEGAAQALGRSFREFIDSDVLLYATAERLYNVFEALESKGSELIKDPDARVTFVLMFSHFFRMFSYRSSALMEHNEAKSDRVARLLNRQNNDFFIMSEESRDLYGHVLSGLEGVGVTRAFLYLFQGNTKTSANTAWKCPNTMLLKSIVDENGARTLSEELQLVRTEKLFINEFVETEGRRTLVAAPLFMGEDLYGMLLAELPIAEIGNLSVISRQLAVSIKSIALVEEQDRVKRELQDSLEQFMKDNTRLNAVAKTDELTGLYNRRGFLEYAVKAITDSDNRNKKALLCYADMDNLKLINDRYGHDDGDFALRLIARILNETFRNTDIIGRIGGDEFVVFAIVDMPDYENVIKKRIADITARNNDRTGKPYSVEVSTGICEFTCGEGVDIYELLDQADEKLYVEKSAKKAKNGSYR